MVGGMMVIELLAGTMRLDRGRIAGELLKRRTPKWHPYRDGHELGSSPLTESMVTDFGRSCKVSDSIFSKTPRRWVEDDEECGNG